MNVIFPSELLQELLLRLVLFNIFINDKEINIKSLIIKFVDDPKTGRIINTSKAEGWVEQSNTETWIKQ